MAIITDIEILSEYLNIVLDKANHHAHNVNEIALAIVGGIIWKRTGNLKVLSREGEMKNVLWLEVGTRRLCFVYNHSSGNIDLREGSLRGTTIQSFNNSTPLSNLKNFFETL